MAVRQRPSRQVVSMANGIARWDGADALTALKEIGADWAPVMEPIHRPNGEAIAGKLAVVNPVANKVLGITSDSYGGLHNQMLSEGIDRLSGAIGLPYRMSRAEMFNDGATVRLEAILGDSIKLGDSDTVYKVVSAFQGHGGNTPFTFLVEFKRLVCSNGLMIKIPGLNTAFRCKHTQNGAARVEWNFGLIQSSFAQATGDTEKAFRLFSEKRLNGVGAREFFRQYASSVLKQKDEKLDQTVSDLLLTWVNGRQQMAGDTMWRAFNALTEYNQHYGFRTDEAMLLSNLDGSAANAKVDAFNFTLAMAA